MFLAAFIAHLWTPYNKIDNAKCFLQALFYFILHVRMASSSLVNKLHCVCKHYHNVYFAISSDHQLRWREIIRVNTGRPFKIT